MGQGDSPLSHTVIMQFVLVCMATNTAYQDQYPSKPVFEILDRGGVAFDHAIIIAAALENLRAQAEKFDIIFEFLPPQFTLSSLQKIQETILGVTMPPAGFRRKISGYVVETEEYTAGAGHRPAKLFRKKQQKAEGL